MMPDRIGTGTSTTSMARLSRRKPWMKRDGFSIPNCCMMSACTVGVAVAAIATTAQHGQVLPQHPVVGPEIVAPLRNAMRLVNRDQRQSAPGQHLRKAP